MAPWWRRIVAGWPGGRKAEPGLPAHRYPSMSETKRRRRWPYVMGGAAVALAAAVLLFQWDWLIPMVNARASAALGRPVTITHLHVKLGRVPHIVADGVTIANPADWPGGGDFATIEHLALDVDAMAYVRNRQVVIPAIVVDKPVVDAQQMADGRANWVFASSGPATSPANSGAETQIGQLTINDGHAHVQSAKLSADFNIDIATKDGDGGKGQIVAAAKGTYAKQPITAQFTGGALLSLRDAAEPYPVNLQLANGPTKVSLAGTVQNPLAFAGADLKLELAGPDMSLLLPLIGIAIPKTPAYRVAGQLDYADGVVKFQKFTGKVGSSDLNGDLQVDTKPDRPVLTAELNSKLVDLKDLGGFIGAEPGDADKGTKRPTRQNGRVLPDSPIDLPKLNVADVHLKYAAARIQGRAQPLDNMKATLDIVNGAVNVHPISFGIGRGQIVANIQLSETGKAVHAKAAIDFQRVDVDKLLNATGVARGAGAIGGRAVIDGSGRSLAEILGRGNGELKLYMGSGGNVSALLVDLSGLAFGNAVLSALGIPTRAQIQCLITDFVLQQGTATARVAVLDTDEARVGAYRHDQHGDGGAEPGAEDRGEAFQRGVAAGPDQYRRHLRVAHGGPGFGRAGDPRRGGRRSRHPAHAVGGAAADDRAGHRRGWGLFRLAPQRPGTAARARAGGAAGQPDAAVMPGLSGKGFHRRRFVCEVHPLRAAGAAR